MTIERPLVSEVRDNVAWLTLNRPDKRNALDSNLILALREALERADDNDAVRVVTIAGAGKDFSAGADLAALERLGSASVEENLRDADVLAGVFLTIRHMRKPVIALVRGRALGGGCGLATACDLVLAAESASFGYTEIRLGFVPAIVMAILRRNLSEKQAFELLTMGEVHSSRVMHRLGLVNRVVPDSEFESAAEEYVRRLSANSASAVWLTKRQLYGQDSTPFEAGLASGALVNVLARMTEATRDGVARFLHERRANLPETSETGDKEA